MTTTIRTLLLSFAFALAATSGVVQAGDDDSKEGDDSKDTVSCVNVKAEARHSGIAYNHLVHLDNQCEFAAQCQVSTNVNKEPKEVVVPSKETRTVLTWRNSPAREFTPHVVCVKQP